MTRPNIDTPPDEPEPPTSMTSPPTPDIASPEPPKSTLEDVDYIRIATQHKGVMQPSAIGAGDDCCDRGRSRSSRALWPRAARQAAPGAHDGSPTGCESRRPRGRDRRRPGIWASVRRTTADRRPRRRASPTDAL